MFLYNEKILVVDLKKGTAEILDLDVELIENHIGGIALNSKLIEMYGDKESVVIGTGPLTGTLAPGGALGIVSSRGPGGEVKHVGLTQFLGAEIKYSGFDFIVINGTSPKPVYLWIHDGVADIEDASGIWGHDTWETVDWIKKEKGDDLVQVLSIGPAGEKQHPNAQVVLNYWSTMDSVGLGGIFGENNLKAVAFRGLGLIDAEEIDDMVKESVNLQKDLLSLDSFSESKGIYYAIRSDKASALKDWLEPLVHRHKSCFGCIKACNTFVKYNEDCKVMESTSVKEPGFLLTVFPAVVAMMDGGFSAESAGRLSEFFARLGVEPLAALNFLKEKQVLEWEKGRKTLEEAINNQTVLSTPELSAPDDDAGQIILGMILGICPQLMQQLPEEIGTKFTHLASLGTGMDFSSVSDLIKVYS